MPKKEKIRKLFDNIAKDYDKLNHILSLDIDRLWRKKAIKEATDTGTGTGSGTSTSTGAGSDSGTGPGLNILDVACGTGDFAIGMGRAAGEGCRITGVDISQGMLEIGRKKTAEAGLSGRITLMEADCESLPFEDGCFDRVTAAFGVRNFEHLETGLKEMHRVLAESGKLIILELSTPENPFLSRLYKLYFLHILPAVGGMVSGNKGAYRYLPASVLKFPRPEKFMEMMSECGFSDIRHRAFSAGICRMYTGIK